MAVLLAVLSCYLMWKSAELPIGWEPRRGPGGGAFPFWLALGMLICCVVIFVRALRGKTPESRSEEPYMDGETIKLIGISAGSIAVTLIAIKFVGVYIAIPLFFVFYIRLVGRHSWVTTSAIAGLSPIFIFFFFEVGLRILLPKGFTEPLFYPLYKIFLST
ncbi:MAG: tripartite tricarboxylate transporter TctB family protein [Pseudomonadota bacterium]